MYLSFRLPDPFSPSFQHHPALVDTSTLLMHSLFTCQVMRDQIFSPQERCCCSFQFPPCLPVLGCLFLNSLMKKSTFARPMWMWGKIVSSICSSWESCPVLTWVKHTLRMLPSLIPLHWLPTIVWTELFLPVWLPRGRTRMLSKQVGFSWTCNPLSVGFLTRITHEGLKLNETRQKNGKTQTMMMTILSTARLIQLDEKRSQL